MEKCIFSGFLPFFRLFFNFFQKKKFWTKNFFFPKSANFSRKNEKMTKKTILRGPRPLKSHFFEKKILRKNHFWTQIDQNGRKMTKNGPFFEKNRFCAEKNDFMPA